MDGHHMDLSCFTKPLVFFLCVSPPPPPGKPKGTPLICEAQLSIVRKFLLQYCQQPKLTFLRGAFKNVDTQICHSKYRSLTNPPLTVPTQMFENQGVTVNLIYVLPSQMDVRRKL